MKKLIDTISNNLFKLYDAMKHQYEMISDLLVKTDDEMLHQLLKSGEDKVKFQKAIDEVIGTNLQKEVILNNHKVVISN